MDYKSMPLKCDKFIGSVSQIDSKSHMCNESLDDIFNSSLERTRMVRLLNDLNKPKYLAHNEVPKVTNVDTTIHTFQSHAKIE